uniref:Uncharacterized protein n=1 Tax=Anguilla anguilla TaxID=7936 RepID=A0A0E9X7S0_ANGAN
MFRQSLLAIDWPCPFCKICKYCMDVKLRPLFKSSTAKVNKGNQVLFKCG